MPSLPPIRPAGHTGIDGCPDCIANTEAPLVSHQIDGGSVAFYHCSDCGHYWSTAWGAA